MKFNVRLLWRAARHLYHIVTWLYERSPQGAEAWHQAWKTTFRTLQSSAHAYAWRRKAKATHWKSHKSCFALAKAAGEKTVLLVEPQPDRHFALWVVGNVAEAVTHLPHFLGSVVGGIGGEQQEGETGFLGLRLPSRMSGHGNSCCAVVQVVSDARQRTTAGVTLCP